MPTYAELIQEIFHEVNQARTNPRGFADSLESTLNQYKSNNAKHRPGAVPIVTREGINAAHEAIQALRSAEPIQALTWSEGLGRAAQAHCNDTGSLGIVGHIGSKENTLQDRLEYFGRWSECIAEALDYGSVDAFETVCTFLIDDGLSTRPHRNALLNQRFNKVGIGAAPHTEYKTVISLVLAGGFKDKDDLEHVDVPEGDLKPVAEVEEWLDGAVKLTCEIRTETEAGKTVKKVKKYWEMSDGSTQITEATLEQKEEA
mmetsp:Transcript_22024/g.21718  ORF Transcript_22024/g.21718 Transcript_22024/m.21718 type:complete len:259 (-) Transcript_22024:41-817(-)